jgi:ferritin-like metal-binding protein YciE
MKYQNLKDLLISKISALYDIENVLVKALPKLAKAARNAELKEGFETHLAETKNHVQRLEKAFSLLDTPAKKLKCEGIRGIVEDGEWVIKNIKPETALDANLARAAQYAEHYEIAGYMGAISWAKELGEDEVASLLTETLEEEKEADKTLDKAGEKLQKEIVS